MMPSAPRSYLRENLYAVALYRRIAIEGTILASTVGALTRRAQAVAEVIRQLKIAGLERFGFGRFGALVR